MLRSLEAYKISHIIFVTKIHFQTLFFEKLGVDPVKFGQLVFESKSYTLLNMHAQFISASANV